MDNKTQRGAALIADDHSLYRSGLSFLLKDRLGFSSVIEAESFDRALDRLAETKGVELALFDLAMPGVSGPDSLGVVKEIYPDMRVAIVSGSEHRGDVLKAVSTGLNGYVPKALGNDDMVLALHDILDGRIYVPRFMTATSVGHPHAKSEEESAKGGSENGGGTPVMTKAISPRQRDVLACVRRGLSNKEIARELDIAEGTVKIHLAALFSHYSARNRTELATKA